MKAVFLLFDSLNRHLLPPYAPGTFVKAPNFERLAQRTVTLDNLYAGSMPCMPARRELHTGRYNFLHRSWGPLEPFDDSMPELLGRASVHTHLVSDHPHYWEDGGATYHTRYTTWEFFRGQEGDPWKGAVEVTRAGRPGQLMRRQDEVNRRHMPTEAEHSQTRTFDAGLEFLRDNAAADRWLLQIETFDPHEPFFAPESYRDRYPDHYQGPPFDWPGYDKVVEPADQVEHARNRYAALVSMCDHSLGRVLDAMDEHGLWEETLLIVTTDHGYLLGDHGWWAKNVMPWFNELVHLPGFIWDPRRRERGTRREDLVQTIDLPPTILRYFDVPVPPDMQGADLAELPDREVSARDGALFGVHGGHVNVTDGRYVYMRAARDRSNEPLDELTLMPTHMRARFSTTELREWEPAGPLAFTKDVRVLRIRSAGGVRVNSWLHGTQLYDLETDPGQEHPLVDDPAELRMLRLLVELMRWNAAPASQFERLDLPFEGDPGPQHLRARADLERVTEMLAPLPRAADLPHSELATRPLRSLLEDARMRAAVDQHLPQLAGSDLHDLLPGITLLGLARAGAITEQTLMATLEDLARG